MKKFLKIAIGGCLLISTIWAVNWAVKKSKWVLERRDQFYNYRKKFAHYSLNDSTRKLLLREHFSPRDVEIFDKKNLTELTKESSWADLQNQVDAIFAENKEYLTSNWRVEPDELKAAFYLNFVHNLWAIGSKGEDGSLINFEATSLCYRGRRKNTPYDYVMGKNADCNDFALMLFMLLNGGGYPTKNVGTEEHIYVETEISGKKYIFDALYNFYTQMSHDEFLGQGIDQVSTYNIFRSDGSNPASDKFRRRRGGLRFFYLASSGRTFRPQPRNYDHWNKFEKWIELGHIPCP